MHCLSMKFLVRPIATLWWNWVEVPYLQLCSRFPNAYAKRRSSYDPKYFGATRKLSFEQFSSSLFIDNFYDAFFQHRLIRNHDLNAVFQNSFLRRGLVISVLCILFGSSKNFDNSPSSISWYLQLHLLRLHRYWRRKMSDFLLYVLFLPSPIQLLEQIIDLVLDPHGRWSVVPLWWIGAWFISLGGIII